MSARRKVVIIGSGPAGYTAAIYTARANLAPLVFTGVQPGGQLMLAAAVENYPGFADGIDGPPLMESFGKQAERFGAELVAQDVVAVDFARHPFGIRSDDLEVEAEAVIVATGASAKRLGVGGESALLGRGVSTCATCDGFFFKDQRVVVVGGGDSAMEEALYLARLARTVAIVHRRDEFRAAKIMQDRVRKSPRIDLVLDTVVEDILDPGQRQVTAVRLRNVRTGARQERPVDGVFVAIGHEPSTALFRGQLALHPNGYVQVEPGTTRTSVPGVFAAGDVQDSTYRQAVTAAGTGCMAALEAERYLESSG